MPISCGMISLMLRIGWQVFKATFYFVLKFIYSEKATKFYETFDWHYWQDKSKVKILQNFVVLSEYMNFLA